MTIKEPCLQETDIAAFIEGRFSGGKLEAFERYLSEHDPCFEELLAIQRSLNYIDIPSLTDTPRHVMKKVRGLYPQTDSLLDLVLDSFGNILKVLSHSSGTTLMLQGATSALRTDKAIAAQTVVIRKNIDQFEAKLEIEKDAKGFCIIKVDLSGDEVIRTEHMRAEVLSDGRILASELLHGGHAVFDVLEPGRYSIVFRKNRQTLGEITIRIKGPLSMLNDREA